MVSDGPGKPNSETSKDRDLCKRVEGQNVLNFGSQIVKEFTIVRGVRGEIDSTDKFT
ncbi:hypothetical protein E2C01_072587 [Portunus trituberculatus]|uniref:Uncharacterized protein n=1 Tax=Portunus trituberculatus TaxID=210409 RepID=A0A5B7I882_PORTR|nr:hypothetical protein [Portunus trituberculatus]